MLVPVLVHLLSDSGGAAAYDQDLGGCLSVLRNYVTHCCVAHWRKVTLKEIVLLFVFLITVLPIFNLSVVCHLFKNL